jgi:hypothetical protein
MCLLAVAGGKFTVNTRGDAYDTSAFNRSSFFLRKYDVKPQIKVSSTEESRLYGVDLGARPLGQKNAFSTNGIVKRYGQERPDVLVLGDSHAIMWAAVIDDVCREKGLTVSFFATAGASPFFKIPVPSQMEGMPGFTPQQKRQFDMRRLECIKEWKPLVILSARWAGHLNVEESRDLIDYIGQCGARVLLVEQPPQVDMGNHNSAQYLTYRGYSPSQSGHRISFPQAEPVEVARGQATIRSLAREYPFCSILKTYDYYAPDDKNAFIIDGRNILYIDNHHLTTAGTFLVRSRFVQALSNLGVDRTKTRRTPREGP